MSLHSDAAFYQRAVSHCKKHGARTTKCNAETDGPFLSNTQTSFQSILIDFTMNKESEIAQALNLFGNSLTAGDQDALRGLFTDFFCEQSGAQTRAVGE